MCVAASQAAQAPYTPHLKGRGGPLDAVMAQTRHADRVDQQRPPREEREVKHRRQADHAVRESGVALVKDVARGRRAAEDLLMECCVFVLPPLPAVQLGGRVRIHRRCYHSAKLPLRRAVSRPSVVDDGYTRLRKGGGWLCLLLNSGPRSGQFCASPHRQLSQSGHHRIRRGSHGVRRSPSGHSQLGITAFAAGQSGLDQ